MSDTPSPLGLWLSFIKTYRLIQAELAEKLAKEFSLSLPQFQLLAQLAGHDEGRSMSELADALLMSNGNITGLTTRLAKKDWIIIAKDPNDKRISKVWLSKDGQARFADILSAYEAWVEALFAPLHEQDTQELRLFLRKIRPQPPAN